MPEMFSWYIDNNRYPTKAFVDEMISFSHIANKDDKEIKEVVKKHYPSIGNESAPVTAARDFGLLNMEELSDAVLLYEAGFYGFSDLIFDLMSKRNVSKSMEIALKPLVVLAKVFWIMYSSEVESKERFISTSECYEYLSVLEDYEQIDETLIQTIVSSRVYEDGKSIPQKRIQPRNEVCLAEIFSALSESVVFQLGEQKTILCIDERYIELIEFIANNGYKISFSPTVSRSNNDILYNYLSNIKNGIIEILPDIPLLKEVPAHQTKELYNYLFGVVGCKTETVCEYFAEDCFGKYRIFYPIRNILFAKLYLKNQLVAERLADFSRQTKPYIEKESEGKLVIKRPYEFGHTIYDELVEFNPTPERKPRDRKTHTLNRILYGAPGTGKTYATAQYALAVAENKTIEDIREEDRTDVMERYNSLIKEGQIVFTTFHQNYGYEDFIQGIRPDVTKKDMSFKNVDGVFKIIANRAMKTPEKDFIIIIDEINRANISKVFGELITLIEEDKRWGEKNAVSVMLPSGEIFAVPNNLYIVGTMNSADKSISLIDTALRRRFEFVEFTPDLSLISNSNLKKILEKLNEGIANELKSTDLLVGHSYFIGKTDEDVCDIMNKNIIPLLYEYFFDNQKKVENQIKKAVEVEGLNVEVKSGKLGRIRLVKRDDE